MFSEICFHNLGLNLGTPSRSCCRGSFDGPKVVLPNTETGWEQKNVDQDDTLIMFSYVLQDVLYAQKGGVICEQRAEVEKPEHSKNTSSLCKYTSQDQCEDGIRITDLKEKATTTMKPCSTLIDNKVSSHHNLWVKMASFHCSNHNMLELTVHSNQHQKRERERERARR